MQAGHHADVGSAKELEHGVVKFFDDRDGKKFGFLEIFDEDGQKTVTLKGDHIAAEFKDIIERYVQRTYKKKLQA